jgi:flagellar basal body-associated protein FliL
MAKSVPKKASPQAQPATIQAAAAAPKKRTGATIGIALLGIILGSGGAGVYFLFVGPHAEARAAQAKAEALAADALLPPETMKIERMVLPMITSDGELRSYVTVEMVLELERSSSDFVKVRLPMIRHSFNEVMATQSAMTPNNDGLDYAAASVLLTNAANKALGGHRIIKVNIVTAVPI